MAVVDSSKVIEFIKNKWKNSNCPYCNQSNWNVASDIFQLTKYSGNNNIIIGGEVMPIVPIMCTNCGHTVMLNAILSNAVAAPQNVGGK